MRDNLSDLIINYHNGMYVSDWNHVVLLKFFFSTFINEMIKLHALNQNKYTLWKTYTRLIKNVN